MKLSRAVAVGAALLVLPTLAAHAVNSRLPAAGRYDAALTVLSVHSDGGECLDTPGETGPGVAEWDRARGVLTFRSPFNGTLSKQVLKFAGDSLSGTFKWTILGYLTDSPGTFSVKIDKLDGSAILLNLVEDQTGIGCVV